MEGIGIVVAVRDAGNAAVALPIQGHKAPAEAFRRSGDKREIQTGLFRLFVGAAAHVPDDLKTQLLRLITFAVVRAQQGLEGFGQPDKTHSQGAVLEHFADAVIPVQLAGVQPDAVAHEEGIIAHLLAALNLEPVQQLAEYQVNLVIQQGVKFFHIALCLKAQARQIH